MANRSKKGTTRYNRAPNPDTRMYPISRSIHQREHVSQVIPVDDIVGSCHLLPRFGSAVNRDWDSDTVLEECKSFNLNHYITLGEFYAQAVPLSHDSHQLRVLR